ncbi:O-antigen ligase family protein [Crassaminicella profunda]|uniref:O-antigen ligase family protein n=1 Tax=Crassaminicella profunda TaxID=1286698 RepID=UPI001CA6BEF8|nr:O-antigen ligase family protein [Crassaminicella profunda]QZY55541.1 O-antigen ligase family protein [Crassaminicella profunda]
MFFEKELLPTHIFTFGLGIAWFFTKIRSKGKIIRSIPDILGLAIVGMYFISIFYGVNTRLAIGEFLKYANYYMIYLLVRDFTADDEKNKKTILNVLLLSGVVVSIIGIGSAIGTFSYNGAFVHGRINSTFQYPNALASYLFALFIVALGLLQNSKNIKEKFFYSGIANLFIFTFIPTFSRGMWILAPIIAIVYLALVPKNKKIETFIYGLIMGIPAIVFSSIFIKGIEKSNVFVQWGLVIVSILGTIGVVYLCEKKLRSFRGNLCKYVFVRGLIVIFILSILGGIAFNTTQPLTLSNVENENNEWRSIYRNISDVFQNEEYRLEVNVTVKNPKDKPYAGRIDIYSVNDEGELERLTQKNIVESKPLILNFTTTDTTEVIRIYFRNYYSNTEVIFNEAELYDEQKAEKIKDIKLKYKYIPESLVARINSYSANDNSIQARTNFYRDGFNVIKDYSILGAGGGAWETLYFTYQSYLYWTTQAHNYFMQLWIEIGILGLIVYITFIGILLWNMYKGIKNLDNVKTKLMQVTICTGWLTLFIHSIMDFDLSLGAISILLWTLLGLTNQSQLNIKKKEINNRLRYIPMMICMLLVIGCWNLNFGQKNIKKAIVYVQSNDIQNAIQYFERATKNDPFNGFYHMDLASLYAMIGKQEKQYSEKAIKEIKRAVELESYNVKVLKKAAQIYMQMGELDKGLDYMDKAVKVQPMNPDNYADQTQTYLAVGKHYIDTNNQKGIAIIADEIPNLKAVLNNNSQSSLHPFKYDKNLHNQLQKLDYFWEYKNNMEKLKGLNKVIVYSQFNMDLDKNGIPDGLEIWNTEEGNLRVKKEDEYILLTNRGDDYGILYTEKLSLQEERKYKLEIEYSSTLKDEDFDLYVYDLTNKSKVIAKLENVKRTKEFIKVALDIMVPKGVVAGKQKVGIVHRGKSNEVIKIKNINIIQK